MHAHAHEKSKYVSHSECKTAQHCGFEWYGKWHLGLQSSDGDSPPARIGSMAHAIDAARTRDRVSVNYVERGLDFLAAHEEAVDIRRWWDPEEIGGDPEWFAEEFSRALAGADVLMTHVSRGLPLRLPASHPLGPVPVVERRLHATWAELVRVGFDTRLATAMARVGRLGIEGQPDLAHLVMERGVDTTYIDDYKFRQKPDLGGTVGRADTDVVDPQGAYYAVLLRAVGALRDEPVVFRQVNVYAGPWLTCDDFVADADSGRGQLTVDGGLPSRDLENRLKAMVTPREWAEAWRVLGNRRYDARLEDHRRKLADHRAFMETNPKSRRQPPKAPEMFTANEEEAARAFLAELERRPLVQEQRCPLDPSACLEVVRDMVAAVLGHELTLAAGLTPGRVLDTHPRGSCVRPYGCDLQAPCKASLGTGKGAEVLRSFAEDGRLRLRVLDAAGVGDVPSRVA